VNPKIFKSIVLRTPVLGQLVSERHRLRSKVASYLARREPLRAGSPEASNSGYCHCCRRETVFVAKGSWLRDQYLCSNCLSIPRQRHMQYVLDTFFKGWEEKNIHESSPSNELIARYCSSYSSSQYLPGVQQGTVCNGVRCENLEALTFEDETFDIFITQDVFEHIFNPELAAREISRVLKPGGAHVFTAPKHKGLGKSYARARMLDGQIEYLKEEAYHGNPVGDGRALVTWDYGDDFEDLMNSWSNSHTTTYIIRDRALGIDGEYLEVFVTRKMADRSVSQQDGLKTKWPEPLPVQAIF